MTHPLTPFHCFMTISPSLHIGYAPFHPAYRERAPTSNRPWATGRGEHLTGDLTGRGELLTGDVTGRAVTSSHPSSLTYNLTLMGFEEEELVEAGLTVDGQSNYGRGDNLTGDLTGARYRYYDRFRGRLMVPIRNEQGAGVAFGGRALDMPSKIPSQTASQTASQIIDESAHTNALGALAAATAVSVSGRARVTLERGDHLTGDFTGPVTASGGVSNSGTPGGTITGTGTDSGSSNTGVGKGIGSATGVGGATGGSSTVAKYLNSPESDLFKKVRALDVT